MFLTDDGQVEKRVDRSSTKSSSVPSAVNVERFDSIANSFHHTFEKSHLNPRSDVELVFAVKQNDTSAFAELVTRHYSVLRKFCLRFAREPGDSDLIAAETIGAAYKQIQKFEGRSSFRSWLLKIVLQTGGERLKQEAETGSSDGELLLPARMAIQISRLAFAERLSLTLRLFEGFGFKEIASVLGGSAEEAKMHYRQAFLKLRNQFGHSKIDQVSGSEQFYGADWWIEFLEGEVDPAFAKDMAILVQNSASDRAVLDELQDLRSRLIVADRAMNN